MNENAFSSFFFETLGADVTIVLHVGAVELDQLGVIFRDSAGDDVLEPLGDGAAQVVALFLDELVLGAVCRSWRLGSGKWRVTREGR